MHYSQSVRLAYYYGNAGCYYHVSFANVGPTDVVQLTPKCTAHLPAYEMPVSFDLSSGGAHRPQIVCIIGKIPPCEQYAASENNDAPIFGESLREFARKIGHFGDRSTLGRPAGRPACSVSLLMSYPTWFRSKPA